MRYCPITYQLIQTEAQYSKAGLKNLSPLLKQLQPLPYTALQLREKARCNPLMLPGTQPKLGAQLKVKENRFDIVDSNSRYIIKPPSEFYPERVENEALTMSLAATLGLEVPPHGLLFLKDKNKAYFIKRFDRTGHNQKITVEDFAQLSQQKSDTKYQGSMEKVANMLMQYTSFPKVEALKLFKLTLFNFLVGNDDMHLKRFALVTRGQMITLSPAYGLFNASLIANRPRKEIALSLNKKTENLNQMDFFDYFAKSVLQLNETSILPFVHTLRASYKKIEHVIQNSFLSPRMKANYRLLLEERFKRLGL